MPKSHTIGVTAHGRYLVDERPARASLRLLVGFHGYGESAEMQLDRLRQIPVASAWLCASIQGLNRFYRGRTTDVVAGWMTRQDRELAIADNVAYVSAVVDEIAGGDTIDRIVFAGFSQGVAMAYRAACASPRPVAGVIAIGADVPPELDAVALRRIGAALVGRGRDDRSYREGVFGADIERLRLASVDVQAITIAGGHEWTCEFSTAAGSFLGGRS